MLPKYTNTLCAEDMSRWDDCTTVLSTRVGYSLAWFTYRRLAWLSGTAPVLGAIVLGAKVVTKKSLRTHAVVDAVSM